MNACILFFVTLPLVLLCEGVTIQIRNPIVEGENLTVICRSDSGGGGLITLAINGQTSSSTRMVNGSEIRFNVGTVSRSNANDVYRCSDQLDNTNAMSSPLVVRYIDSSAITGDPANTNISLNGVFTASFTTDSFPPVNNVELLRNGQVLTDRRFFTNTSTVMISDIQCDDNGTYTLRVSNEAGSRTATFPVNVQTSAPSWVSNIPPINVGLALTNVGLASQVNACPDTITITCRVIGGDTLQPVVVDVADNTPVYWSRQSFSIGTGSGSSTVTCDASNGIMTVTRLSTSFTVNYGAIACHDSPLCLGLVLGIVLFVALIVTVIVIVVIVVVIKKNKQTE